MLSDLRIFSEAQHGLMLVNLLNARTSSSVFAEDMGMMWSEAAMCYSTSGFVIIAP